MHVRTRSFFSGCLLQQKSYICWQDHTVTTPHLQIQTSKFWTNCQEHLSNTKFWTKNICQDLFPKAFGFPICTAIFSLQLHLQELHRIQRRRQRIGRLRFVAVMCFAESYLGPETVKLDRGTVDQKLHPKINMIQYDSIDFLIFWFNIF